MNDAGLGEESQAATAWSTPPSKQTVRAVGTWDGFHVSVMTHLTVATANSVQLTVVTAKPVQITVVAASDGAARLGAPPIQQPARLVNRPKPVSAASANALADHTVHARQPTRAPIGCGPSAPVSPPAQLRRQQRPGAGHRQ